MVEITYQMALNTIQTLGLLVGITYYIMTLNYSRKNREMQLETRQAQLLTTFTSILVSNESLFNENMYWYNHTEFTYEEFKEKHPPESVHHNSLSRLFNLYEVMGLLCRRGLLDVELTHETFNFQWDKFKPVVKGMQLEMGNPFIMEHYEWIGEEWPKIRDKKLSKH